MFSCAAGFVLPSNAIYLVANFVLQQINMIESLLTVLRYTVM